MTMAARRKYSRNAGSDVKSEVHRYKRGTAKSGPGGRGGKVTSSKQAVAIGLSEARQKGRRSLRGIDEGIRLTKSAVVGPTKRRLIRILGPGLITGASDDDPSGIATYSQAGAHFGFTITWTLVFTFPLMATIQEISGHIGRTTVRGVARELCSALPELGIANDCCVAAGREGPPGSLGDPLRAFYAAIVGATLSGIGITVSPIDPVKALINGIVRRARNDHDDNILITADKKIMGGGLSR